MTTGLLFAVASALVLMYVLLPLTRRRSRQDGPLPPLTWSANGHFRGLDEERSTALEALRDLDFEFQLGNLTEEDYHRLRDRYSRRAMVLMQAVEAADQQLDEEIEDAIQRLRGGRSQPAAVPGPSRLLATCPRCGAAARPQDRFCAACGAEMAARAGRDLSPNPSPTRRGEPRPLSLGGKGVRGLGRLKVPRWAWASAALAAAFGAGVAALYFQMSSSTGQAEPIGTATVAHVHGLLISPQNPGLMFLSHHDGLQVSHNGGRTWTPVPDMRVDGMGMASHPAAPATVYLTGHDVLLKSADSGQTWAPLAHDLPGTDIHAFAVHPDRPQTLYAFVVAHGLFRSDDGGSTWTLLGSSVSLTTAGIAVVPGAPETIYLATQDQGVLVSSDGGARWANASGFVNGALPTRIVKSIVYDPKSGDRYESGGAVFTGALYIATDRGAFRSRDGGQSWDSLSLQSEVAALALDPADGRVLLAADSRGNVFRSPDRGLTWRGS